MASGHVVIGEGAKANLCTDFQDTGIQQKTAVNGSGKTEDIVIKLIAKDQTFQFIQTQGGSTTGTLEVSNDGQNWEVGATFTTTTQDSATASAPWKFYRINVSANSGGITVLAGT